MTTSSLLLCLDKPASIPCSDHSRSLEDPGAFHRDFSAKSQQGDLCRPSTDTTTAFSYQHCGFYCSISKKINNFKLDEINLLFQPNMRSKLLWFYQEVDEPETVPVPEAPKPGPSRAAASNASKTPQGEV